jgi:hypothetical protein
MFDYYGCPYMDNEGGKYVRSWNMTAFDNLVLEEYCEKHKNDFAIVFDEHSPKIKTRENVFYQYLKIIQEKAHRP